MAAFSPPGTRAPALKCKRRTSHQTEHNTAQDTRHPVTCSGRQPHTGGGPLGSGRKGRHFSKAIGKNHR